MSRNKDYQRLLNSRRWKELRQWKLRQNPLCEMCEAEGKVSATVDIHHKRPVETAVTLEEMEALCFNPANLQGLCIYHHRKVHLALKSQSKDAHQERRQQALERWKERHKLNNGLQDTQGKTGVDTPAKD